jgi:rubrerythrin
MTESEICPKCGYKWEKRVENPKACPKCKVRLDIKRDKK